jgi:hypothetical protein
MDRLEAESRIREVQRIMERTTLYTLLPGPPAIVGGVLALIGCVVSYLFVNSLDFAEAVRLPLETQLNLFLMWAVIGAAAVATEILWTRAASRKLGITPLTRPARFAAYSLSPSVFVACVLTLVFVTDDRIGYIAPVWMMCYGTGVYAAGLFSVRLPRMLGLLFIVTGAVGLLALREYGIALTALSFGLYHIAFGVALMRRSRRTVEA